MKKLLSSPEVISAIITVLGTLLVGIILGVAEGKIGFTSLLAVVAALVLALLVYLLYRRSGPRTTALAGLIETINVDVFGGPDGLACGADGLWITNPFADVSRYSYRGVKLAQTSADSATGSLPQVSPAIDAEGHLYLVSRRGRKIYQFTTRPEAVSSYPTPAWEQRNTTPLARPLIRPLTNAAQTMVSITNNLAVPLTLSLDKENPTEHYATVLLQGQGYSALVQPGIYTVFASTSGQGMVMYSSRELLVKGYAFSWVVSAAQ